MKFKTMLRKLGERKVASRQDWTDRNSNKAIALNLTLKELGRIALDYEWTWGGHNKIYDLVVFQNGDLVSVGYKPTYDDFAADDWFVVEA